MAKKKKKKPESKSELARGKELEPEKRAYWEDRLRGFLDDPTRTKKAQQTMERLWPPDVPEAMASRVAWLLVHMPERGFEELERAGDNEALEVAVASTVPALDEASFKRLLDIQAFNESWRNEALLVRRAIELVCSGKDEDAAELLRGVGLRSPFREARVFLRGLSAFYLEQLDEARRVLSKIDPYSPLFRAGRAFLKAFEEKKVSIGGASDPHAELAEVSDLVRAGNANQALRKLGKIQDDLSPEANEGLIRALAAVFLREGLDHTQVIPRFSRALSPSEDDPRWHRLDALCAEAQGHTHCAISAWSRYGIAIKDARISARLQYRLARLMQELAAEDEEDGPLPFFFLRSDTGRRLRDDAAEALQAAIDEDPDFKASWLALDALYGELGKDPERGRLADAMVEHFGDDPAAAVLAARAALERGALDKGLRFIKRAVEDLPFDVEAHNVLARILIAKAYKEWARKKKDRARQYADEAAAIDRQSADEHFETLTARAALALIEGDRGTADEARRRALARKPRPWLWAAEVAVAQDRFGHDVTDVPIPSESLDEDELFEIIDLEEETGVMFFRELIDEGIAEVCPKIDDPETLIELDPFAVSLQTMYKIFARGRQLQPEDGYFQTNYYRLAMKVDDVDALDDYEETLQTLDRALDRMKGKVDPERVQLLRDDLENLRENIEDYLALKKTRKKPSPARGKKGRKK